MARRIGQPTLRSRRLALELRRLRQAAGLTQVDVARALDTVSSNISRIENAAIGIYPDTIDKLLDLYRVTGQARLDLLDTAQHAEDRGWLRTYGGSKLPEDWQTWADFESEASTIRHYHPLMIPGLLQTPEYARAIIRGTEPTFSATQVDALVSSRLSRHELFNRTNPLKLHTILEETILARQVGGLHAHIKQLRHLQESAQRSTITIQVLPTAIAEHSGLYGSFIVLEYDDKPTLIWLEQKKSSVFLDDAEQVDVYIQVWDELSALAHTPADSFDLIATIADQLDP